MTTFLGLCQRVASESGTMANVGSNPASVVGQTGRNYSVVSWTATAYEQIQRKADWRWLHADFSGQTIASVREYDSTAMGISERFGAWLYTSPEARRMFSAYKTSEGRSDETILEFVDWDYFRQNVLIGTAADTTGKPVYITVDDSDRLQLYPIPDAAYTFRGRYRKAPQVLAANDDVPEMPDEFHEAIVWKSLKLLGQHDEGFNQIPAWDINLAEVMQSLRESQQPKIKLNRTFA